MANPVGERALSFFLPSASLCGGQRTLRQRKVPQRLASRVPFTKSRATLCPKPSICIVATAVVSLQHVLFGGPKRCCSAKHTTAEPLLPASRHPGVSPAGKGEASRAQPRCQARWRALGQLLRSLWGLLARQHLALQNMSRHCHCCRLAADQVGLQLAGGRRLELNHDVRPSGGRWGSCCAVVGSLKQSMTARHQKGQGCQFRRL